jgi:predicted kinase
MTSPVVSPVVLVNGLPAAGKTTLARALSRALRLPLFSKDTIKETHADVLGSQPPPGWPQRRWNAALGAAASETMWALLADAPTGAVLESCWPIEFRHFAVQGLRQPGDRASMEIWCEVPVQIARRASRSATRAIPSTANRSPMLNGNAGAQPHNRYASGH